MNIIDTFVNTKQSQENVYTHITTSKQSNIRSFTSELTALCSTIKKLHQFYSLFPSWRTIFTMRRQNKFSCLFYASVLYIPKFAGNFIEIGVGLENILSKPDVAQKYFMLYLTLILFDILRVSRKMNLS